MNFQQATAQLDRLSRWLWRLTSHELSSSASFEPDALRFELKSVPLGCPPVPTGSYQFVNKSGTRDGSHAYRPGHPLAEFLLGRSAGRQLGAASVIFDYGSHSGKISVVERLVGRSGYLSLTRLSIRALEQEDRLLFVGADADGTPLDQETCEKLFEVGGRTGGEAEIPVAVLEKMTDQFEASKAAVLAQIAERNSRFFDDEIEKLERWAEDLKEGLEQELKELDAEIKAVKKEAKLQRELEPKLALHRKAKDLEAERSRKRRALYDAQDEIDRKKEALISEVEARLEQRVESVPLFTIQWKVV